MVGLARTNESLNLSGNRAPAPSTERLRWKHTCARACVVIMACVGSGSATVKALVVSDIDASMRIDMDIDIYCERSPISNCQL